MTLKLYNTLTRRKEPFTPIDPSNVRMYVCGPTVYQRIHIGNARPLVVFDVLFRLLRHLYGDDKVTYVRNITDIDDRIIDQVRKDGVNGDLNAAVRALTDTTTEAFREDWRALGCLPPTHEPRATDHIDGMIRIIGELVAKGHAYAAEGHVLFDVASDKGYGRLASSTTIAGARIEVAPYKKNDGDFILWKPSTADQPGWESPWGRGRPGWHIECSAMSETLLAPLPFDIHGGGQDLIFPHHENELAQSCCAHSIDEMVTVWMHNGFVDMRGEKMSKSVGNVVRVDEALEMADYARIRRGDIVRCSLLRSHYRHPVNFQQNGLAQSQDMLNRMYRSIEKMDSSSLEVDSKFADALYDDLNLPQAFARLFEIVTALNNSEDNADRQRLAGLLRGSASLLGLLDKSPEEWFRSNPISMSLEFGIVVRIAGQPIYLNENTSGSEIEKVIEERRRLRENKEFKTADAMRFALGEAGIMVEDRPDGSTGWRRA